MADIKINGNTYNGIERVRFVGADGMSSVQFSDASVLDGLITNTLVAEYFNSQVTSVVNVNVFKYARIGVINMPNVKSIASQAFMGCWASEIRFEGLETCTNGSTFLSMFGLTKAVFGAKLSNVATQMFNGCSKLATLVLPYEGVASLGTDALKSTAIANGTGYVYVPSAQVDNYKADSNWSVYADRIRAIEDYPDEVA